MDFSMPSKTADAVMVLILPVSLQLMRLTLYSESGHDFGSKTATPLMPGSNLSSPPSMVAKIFTV